MHLPCVDYLNFFNFKQRTNDTEVLNYASNTNYKY